MEIRAIERRDAEPTRAIYNAAVEAGLSNLDHLPRSAEQHLAWIEDHFGSYPGIVAVEGDAVLGFAGVSRYLTRSGYTTTVENSIYVDAAARGQGVGRALLEALCERAHESGFHAIIARIVTDNPASIALHAACGFDVVGIEREVGRKRGRWYDVQVMQRLLK